MGGRKLNDKQIIPLKDKLIKEYLDGATILGLQKKYNLHRHTLRRRFDEWGIPRLVRFPRGKTKKHANINGTFFCNIKKNAESRNIAFNITIEEIWDLFVKQNKQCSLSGLELTIPSTLSEYKSLLSTASLDRIDSTKGYTIDNVQWIHKKLNIMRNRFTIDEFISFCKIVCDFQKNNTKP